MGSTAMKMNPARTIALVTGDELTVLDSKLASTANKTVASEKVGEVELMAQFDMEDIEMIDSYSINAFNKDVAYLQKLEPDRLLAGFREVAGLPVKADRYGGWESMLIQGHTLGHYLTALAQAYRETQNDADSALNADLKSRLDYIIDELELCQNANGKGFLFATEEKQFDVLEGTATGDCWVPWYTMHKILAGIIDVYKYEGNLKALWVAGNLGDWVYGRTSSWSDATRARVLSVEYGGMNDCLYELYKITQNVNHLAAAHAFDEDGLFATIADGLDILAYKHANTIIPKFIGAVNRYRALGPDESFYLEAAEQFWNMVVNDHTYVTGGNSEDEHFREAGQLDSTRSNVNNETCNSHNMLKLTRELYKLTGDIKYADFYERTYINEIMSSIHPETGMTTYFKAMGAGYFKVFGSETNHFWCCTGTGMENFTKLDDSLYYHTDTELYVGMYLSSRVNWKEKGFVLIQEADIPSSDTVRFTIAQAPGTAVKIKFRCPEWIARGRTASIKLNSAPLTVTPVKGYLDIDRIWNAGDVIELTLPMEVQVSRLPDNKNAVAFTYGPVVLSAGLGTEAMVTDFHGILVLKAAIPDGVHIKDNIVIYNDTVDGWLNNINSNLIRTEGALAFTLRNTDEDDHLVFTPHYMRYTDRYGIYFKLSSTTTETYHLTVDVSAGGTVTPSSGAYASGTRVTLVATAHEGYEFVKWSGDVSGTGSNITLIMDSDKTINAIFKTKSVDGVCDHPEFKFVPMAQDGTGEYCWFTTDNIGYVNSWNMNTVRINGVDYTNIWSNTMPDKQDGGYYIYYSGSYSWSHFEAAD
jgi:DUF1680 family protein